MTVTLKLKPELEAGLTAQARASGMTVEEYLLAVVESAMASAVLPRNGKPLAAEERAAAFEAWSAAHRPLPPLTDYAVSRESFHEGHEH
jgi:hypothetical protein